MTSASVLAESALRSVLIAGTMVLMLKAMRVESVVVRHGVWTGVTVLMLFLPVLTAWGPEAPLQILPRVASETVSPILARSPDDLAVRAQAPVTTGSATAAESTLRAWVSYATAVYFLGLFIFLFRLVLGTLQVRRLVRTAVLVDGKLTHPFCATPVTVGWLRPVVILPSHWSQYPQRQLDTILLHEAEHVHRRDPLVQWVALLNRAVFWFHPLAWWLERQLSALAEQVCDAAVLARGCDPHQYSHYLLELARVAAAARGRVAAIGMTMPGALLPQRVRLILNTTNGPPVSGMRLASAVVLCGLAGATLAAGRLAPTTAAAPISDDSHDRPSQSISVQRGSASRGFAVYSNGRLRAHGAITDQDRFDAAKHARGTHYAWLRDGDRLYVITDPNLVKRAFDLYHQADSCSASPLDTRVNPNVHRGRDECRPSDSEMDAARVAPDLVPGLTLVKKALMGRVLTLFETAARNGQASRIR